LPQAIFRVFVRGRKIGAEENAVESGEKANLPNGKQVSIRLADNRRRIGGLAWIAFATSTFAWLIIDLATIPLVPQVQGRAVAGPAQPELEAQIAQLKVETAGLAASAQARLNALSPQQRLFAPPAIWRVTGALTEFKDCADCPQMVVIPAGEFTMGSPPSEQGAEAQHRVILSSPFAVSKFEITFDEWDACVTAGGCGGYRPDDEGWGRGTHPVINISWEDASAYASWLSRKTGQPYRLLSEAEWEYAARAGTTTPFSFGDTISANKANYDGSMDGSGPSDVNRQATMPVGSFPANAFGLHDMHGNASEWVEDCWQDEYTARAPSDGSAWLDGTCNGRVVRGGSWEDNQVELRSAARTGGNKEDRFYTDGLRIARNL
jgi:formylglycine-generating enzyme required for sulfatase activity